MPEELPVEPLEDPLPEPFVEGALNPGSTGNPSSGFGFDQLSVPGVEVPEELPPEPPDENPPDGFALDHESEPLEEPLPEPPVDPFTTKPTALFFLLHLSAEGVELPEEAVPNPLD